MMASCRMRVVDSRIGPVVLPQVGRSLKCVWLNSWCRYASIAGIRVHSGGGGSGLDKRRKHLSHEVSRGKAVDGRERVVVAADNPKAGVKM